jgi:hypothetical protein
MNKKNVPIYLCSPNEYNFFKITDVSTVADHKVGYHENKLVVLPVKIDPETINPKNLLILKEKFVIKELLLIDRIKGMEGIVTITDHVNVSGQNLLRAKTPQGELPQFPDMSKIYNFVEGYYKTVVHTVGFERFKNQHTSNNIIYSELVGLIAPVAHYVGIKLFALGLSKPDDILDII